MVQATILVTLEDGSTWEIVTENLDLTGLRDDSLTKMVSGISYPEHQWSGGGWELLKYNSGPAYVTLDFAAKAVEQGGDGKLYTATWRPVPIAPWEQGDVVLSDDLTYVRLEKKWQGYSKGNRQGRLFSDEHMDYLIRDRGFRAIRRGGKYL